MVGKIASRCHRYIGLQMAQSGIEEETPRSHGDPRLRKEKHKLSEKSRAARTHSHSATYMCDGANIKHNTTSYQNHKVIVVKF